ncbi:hypothetical protein [Myroides odoratus]|uniref:Uncharacterized protein n=1 Tax=Myroides odoratus TaxID=256 RepID=A0A9Q6Z5Z9_MYROD|nr:hypothetical protein [Myroides odoratus]EHQ41674.1 hypothetical protein Myrod_0838 [Myroides odoratus DSM 2801]EKB08836.1 hypothetical protein HMPREF9716_00606 [Myroides odoratus CIP 103059]QQT99081.1 hypothetical protein I6I88_12770 [Myroides odoratus]WQD58727.1 hypothetical protein U0010_06195 [Myroides odoratus]STZ28933.1 Uncharacterised protein [Myroides odoratus]
MKNKNKNKVDLYPALWVIVWDVAITAIYQPKEYWQGNLRMVNEGNPIGYICMTTNQYGLFYLAFIWLVAVVLFAKILPYSLSKTFLLFVFISHNIGIVNWMLFKNHFVFAILFILLNSLFFDRKEICSNSKTTLFKN